MVRVFTLPCRKLPASGQLALQQAPRVPGADLRGEPFAREPAWVCHARRL